MFSKVEIDMKKIIISFVRLLSKVAPKKAAIIAFRIFTLPRRSKRKPLEEEFWDSGQRISVASGRSARSWGEGETIFFIHGWESRGSHFYKIIPYFLEAGFRCVVWDGPAHGNSPGKYSNAPDFARCLKEDLVDIGTVRTIVGHSMGGASLGILARDTQILADDTNLVFVSSPSSIREVFNAFSSYLGLSKKSAQELIFLARDKIGMGVDEASLLFNDLSIHYKNILVVHDCDDREISFENFNKLKTKWSGGTFSSTSGFGHRRIVGRLELAEIILKFISERIDKEGLYAKN